MLIGGSLVAAFQNNGSLFHFFVGCVALIPVFALPKPRDFILRLESNPRF